jgi:hypothetical protein
MEKAKEEVVRWNGSKCGLLAIEEKENINAEELEDIREEALSLKWQSNMYNRLIQVESLEEKWKECNDEYVEVFLLVAEVVFDQIGPRAC